MGASIGIRSVRSRRGKNRWWDFVTLISAVVLVSAAQDRPERTVVSLRDFGLASVRNIRAAEIAIVHAGGKVRLDVRALSEQVGRRAEEERSQPAIPQATNSGRRPKRATWVWNTEEVARDSALRNALFRFVREESFDVVFLQLPPPMVDSSYGAYILPASELLPIVQGLATSGASVQALAGEPGFIFPEGRKAVRQLVFAVAAYNRGVPEHDRFAGVHLDVEPYLLPGFGSRRRAEYLSAYTTMIAEASFAAHTVGLTIGVDIPFWFDEQDELTGERFEAGGATEGRPVLELLLPLVDAFCVMSYSTTVDGPGGVATAARQEVRLAGASGKEMFVSLETTPLADEWIGIVRGMPYEGYPIPHSAPSHLLMRGRGDSLEVQFVPDACADSVNASPEREGAQEEGCFVWPLSRLTAVPASRLSFAGRSAEVLRDAETRIRSAFAGVRGFAGTAVHDWMNYRKMRSDIRTPGPEQPNR